MLNGKQKRYLRALANTQSSLFQIGKDGLSTALLSSLNDAFNTHELLKINILKTCDTDLNELAVEICAALRCELAQKIGRTLVLYKRNREPKIILP